MKAIIILSMIIILLQMFLAYVIINNNSQKSELEFIIKDNLTELKELVVEVSIQPIVRPGKIYALTTEDYVSVIEQLRKKGIDIRNADLISFPPPPHHHYGFIKYYTMIRHMRTKTKRDIYCIYTNVSPYEQIEIINRL